MVMKLTIVLLTAAFIQVHASGVAQNVTIRGQQIPMKNMVAAIEKQTGYVVFCNQEVMALTKPVSVNAYRMPLIVFLNSILADQPVDFFIKDKTIVLFEKKAPPVIDAITDSSRFLPPLSGIIRSADGQPLAGASIALQHGNTSTVSKEDGSFTIDIHAGD